MKKKGGKSVITFYDRQKRILLQDRHGISKIGEEWGFFGGGIETGEIPEQALKREIKEELNFELHDFEFLINYQVFLPNQMYNEIWMFIGPLDNQKIEQKEGRAMKWFTVGEARQLVMNKNNINILDQIEKYLAKK